MDKFEEWEKGNQATSATVMTTAGGNAAAPTVDASGTTPKFQTYENRDANAGGGDVDRSGPYAPEQVPLTHPDEELRVKDFTAHDLNTSDLPNDSAIRATSSGSGEPNVRAATTDSTRIPSSNDDDSRTGGNVR